jgi:hypothetical protein
MKQVVKACVEITPDKVSTDKYYGVTTDSRAGFITHNGTEYKAFCFYYLTTGNSWSAFTSPSIQGLATMLLENGAFKIFEFDSWQELLKWGLTVGK